MRWRRIARQEARDWLQKARAVNPKSLDAMALEGALAYVEGDTAKYQALAAEALKINPAFGEFYRVVGSVTAGYYRFDEAAEQVRRAIQLDRENWRAYAELGTHLMRTGDERGARRMLETAFRQDPYDVITFNLLGLLDTLDQFGTVRDGDLALRLHPDETGVMEPYVTPLAREALDALSKRWEFTPKGPILIEVFPRHDDFAVRNVGLPGMIGALGACFGRVVTMDSPRARPPGEFNWGVTLWHELAHVITLQLSEQRVPRWLTEGISVFEEKRARPEWGREMDIPFARAIDRGQVMKLKDLNSGFTNPETISLAYFQSSLVVDHIVEVYGQPKLRALVQSYATGIDTETAIKQVLGVEIDALQKTFDVFLEQRYGALRKALAAPEGLSADMPLEALKTHGRGQRRQLPGAAGAGHGAEEDRAGQAIEAFERAAALVPHATGPDSPQAQIAEVALAKGDKARAIKALDTLTGVRPFRPRVRAQAGDAAGPEAGCGAAADRAPPGGGASIRSIRSRTPRSAAWRSSAGDPAEAVQMFKRGAGRRSRGPRRRPRRPRGRPVRGRQQRRGPEAGAGRARDRPDLLPRPGPAAEVDRRQVVRVARRSPARPARRGVCGLLARRRSPLAPVADAQMPALPNERLAGLQWTFVAHPLQLVGRRGPRPSAHELLGGSVGHRRARPPSRTCRAASRRSTAIEVERPDRADARRPAPLAVPVDLLRRAGQPAAHRHARCRSCASSCCAAAR